MADVPVHTYVLAGRPFRIEGLSLWQRKQFRKVLKSVLSAKQTPDELTGDEIFALLSDRLLWLLAVILLPDAMTHQQKVQAGDQGLAELETWFEAQVLEPAEVGAVLRDFFTSYPVAELIQAELAPFAAMMRTSIPAMN